MILSQAKLILALRNLEEPIHVGPLTIHAWVRAGMPVVPGWKKPRFILANVLAWLRASQQVDPLELDVRDRMWRKGLKATG